MANIILRGIHFAVLFITLTFMNVAYSSNTVQVRNGSTTYYELSRSSIRGGTVSGLPATHSYNTHVGRPISVTQLSKQGIEIPAIQVKRPFGARFAWKAGTVRNAVKTAIKFGKSKANLYLIGGSFALEYLLDHTDWYVDDEGVIVYNELLPDVIQDGKHRFKGGGSFGSPDMKPTNQYANLLTSPRSMCNKACEVNTECDTAGLTPIDLNAQSITKCVITSNRRNKYIGRTILYISLLVDCPAGTKIGENGCHKFGKKPVTDSMIDDVDFSDYDPKDKDIPLMSPHLGEPDETVITEQPKPIVLPTETTTTQNPDGSTTTTATDTTVNVTINTTNQGDMYVTTTETTTTTTYQDGTQTSRTTETKTVDNKDSTPKTDENDDTKQAIKVELPEIPTDCDLVPTLCDTQKKIIDQDKKFYDWMREPFDGLNEPELPTTKDKDFTRKYPINISEGQCPAPMELHTILAGTVSVSFEPFCQFASILRYLVLTGASIFAAYILLGVVRRG